MHLFRLQVVSYDPTSQKYYINYSRALDTFRCLFCETLETPLPKPYITTNNTSVHSLLLYLLSYIDFPYNFQCIPCVTECCLCLIRGCRRSTTTGRTSSTRSSHGRLVSTDRLKRAIDSINVFTPSQLIGSHMSWQSARAWTCLYWLWTGKGKPRGPCYTPLYRSQADTQVSVYNAFISQAPRAGYLGVLWLD